MMCDSAKLVRLMSARVPVGVPRSVRPSASQESSTTRSPWRSATERIELAYRVFPNLRRYRHRGGTQLSGGERKMLSIARTLTLDADLLLLDEPFEGLSPTIIPALRTLLSATALTNPIANANAWSD